ncbi:MAG: glucose-6-phosphate dehydrogenase [Acidobacteria bacterium]|nr:MAG: glucose-6-phosphate dehydrogenase [Acidobacteriota bacterium]
MRRARSIPSGEGAGPANSSSQLDPAVFVIFGGAGDLTWRKLVPALFDLFQDRSMPAKFSIIGVDRVDLNDDELRRRLGDGVNNSRHGQLDTEAWGEFARHIFYQQGDFRKPETYSNLAEQLAKLDKEWNAKAQRIFYMATPPPLFGVIPTGLGEAGLARDRQRARIVIEKPIGFDLDSALQLNTTVGEHFDECQIFRLDHYLGKETVQNILAFRFGNPLFEPLWNRRYVEYIAITVAEDVGIEHRGGYYDQAGALRDMGQNHLMQLLCLVAMEPMVSFDADEIRNKKVDVLHAVRPIHHDAVGQCVVRGQYGNGWIGGQAVGGYREESGVPPDSQTETFVALRLYIDNWRWQGVPFYLRTGKRLSRQVSEVAIQFRAVPHRAFPPEATLDWQSSRLIMAIQPDQGIVLRFQAKHPGPKMHLRTVEMKFNYQEAFATRTPEAYETLLWDVMENDMTLFMRADQVEAAWRLLMPVFDAWAVAPPGDFPNYAAGTWGPEAAQALVAQQGHSWPLPIDLEDFPPESKGSAETAASQKPLKRVRLKEVK